MRLKKKFFVMGSMMLLMLTMTGCGKTTVDLNKYITIEMEGYDSLGRARYSFDYDGFVEDYGKKIKKNKNASEISALVWSTPAAAMIDLCVNEGLDATDGLSNGDIVTLKWECNDYAAEEYFNVKLKYSDIQQEVSGLKTAGRINLFDYLTVTYNGTAPKGSVVLTSDSDRPELQGIWFRADQSDGLSNGDVIVVTAGLSQSVDAYAEEFGVVPEATEQSYTVEGLPQYATSVDEIPNDLMNQMIAQGEDLIKANIASYWVHPEDLQSVTSKGSYFLTVKPGVYTNYPNFLCIVYKIVALTPDTHETFEYYSYVAFENIILLVDGTATVDLTDYDMESSRFSRGNYYYIGVESLDTLFNQRIVSKIDQYEYTSTVVE